MHTHQVPAVLLSLALAAPLRADEVTLVPVADSTLYESATGALANGAGMHFFAGLNGGGSVRRGLLRFDVAGTLPMGSTIDAVELRLNLSMASSSTDADVTLHRVLLSWSEGTADASGGEGGGAPSGPGDVTWIHRTAPDEFWTAVGGDHDATASAGQTVKDPGAYAWSTTTQLVADVQGWLDQPSTNHGWLLRGDELGGVSTAKRFDTREHPTASLRPMLTVTFTPPAAAPGLPLAAVAALAAVLAVLGGRRVAVRRAR